MMQSIFRQFAFFYAYIFALSVLVLGGLWLGAMVIGSVVLRPEFMPLFVLFAAAMMGASYSGRGFARYVSWSLALVSPVALASLVWFFSIPEMTSEGSWGPFLLVSGPVIFGFSLGPFNDWNKRRKQAELDARMPDWKKKDLPK